MERKNIEILDSETRDNTGANRDGYALRLNAPLQPELIFYQTRRTAAYEFIKKSNENPALYQATPIMTPAGSLYGANGWGTSENIACGQWASHNDGYPYGSITSAGIWALYCVNKPWTHVPPIPPQPDSSDPIAWNEWWWLDNNFTVTENPKTAGSIDPAHWYFYYILSATKALLMNGIDIHHNGTSWDWYSIFANHLTTQGTNRGNYRVISKTPTPYPTVCYWSNPEDSKETDVFSTAAAVLALETALLPYTDYAYSGTNKLILELLSPAELLVTDIYSNKTGCEDASGYTQIPYSTYTGCASEPQRIEISKAGGVYRVKIKATGTGNVILRAKTQFDGFDMSQYETTIEVHPGEIFEYTVSVGNIKWPMTLSCSFAKQIQPTPEITATLTPTLAETPTITTTFTLTHTITPTPMMVNLTLKYKSAQVNIITNDPHPWFRVYNSGSNAIDLTKIEIRYWYRYEGSGQAEQAWVDWAGRMPQGTHLTNLTNIGIISGDYGNNQDRYVKITFREGAGMIGEGEYVEIQTRYNKVDWSNYDQSNDWSFVGYTEYTEWDKVGVYYDGVLIWGEEPGMGTLANKQPAKVLPAEPISIENTYNFPNPCSDNTIIRFSLEKPQEVKIVIYDLNSKIVWNRKLEAWQTRRGINYVKWEIKNDVGMEVSNGIYICKVITQDKAIIKKIVVIKQ